MKKVALASMVVAAAVAVAASTADATPSATCSPQSCGTWQQGPVSIEWSDTNPAGDPSVCPTTTNVESTDPLGTPVDCDDGDGDGAITIHVRVDNHGPDLNPGLDRAADSNGWYNHPVSLLLHGSDALSGVGACDAPSYSGPDGVNVSLSGRCTDNAGNQSDLGSVSFNYDATPPLVAAALDRPPDQNGWYNHAVGVNLADADALSGTGPCQQNAVYSGPNSSTAVASGTCTDQAGNPGTGTVGLKYDDGAPEVTGASADRPPDHDGWFNHPVTFTFHGSDGVSGMAGCSNATYAGPDRSDASVHGACFDNAGNLGSGSQSFKYDATRPAAPTVQETPGNHRVELTWTVPSDVKNVIVSRSEQGTSAAPQVVYSGIRNSIVDKGLNNGTKYSYFVADSDQAGNSSFKVIRAIPTASSLRPLLGSVVSSPPLLTWKKIRGARYYNVQLFFGKKKVWSTWPRTASLQLGSRWHFRGKTHTLLPGHYRWYVWPGFGARTSHRYGHRIGRSSFRVR